VFASNEGTPLEHRNVTRRGFEPAVARAGIENVTFHDMRHAFASRMIARGIEPVTLAKLMGHEDIRETLNTYSHLWDGSAPMTWCERQWRSDPAFVCLGGVHLLSLGGARYLVAPRGHT
jgi:hypothetical protein